MAKITFVILAHENADQVAESAELLTSWNPDANVVIHYDLNSSSEQYNRLTERFEGSNQVHFVKKRIKCGWGDFSLVDAVVRALRVIREKNIACDRVMLVSGACMPVRPLAELSSFLDQHPNTEFIEAFTSDWIVGGLRKERYQYWHFFNFQKNHKLFNAHYSIQKKIWPKRKFPRGLEPRFGSQWWCLSWELCEKILKYVQKHPLVYFFFSTTWIPDEMFFQTMAHKFSGSHHIANRNLTFFYFNECGRPYTFLDDHIEYLKDLPFFFARKISPHAKKLKANLKQVALQPAPEKTVEIDLGERYVFPLKKLLAEQTPQASYFSRRLFQPKGKSPWDDMLAVCPDSFVVLHGPPQLTRKAALVLAPNSQLEVLGRLFGPGHVDFGSGRTRFKGLNSQEHLIRDYDPSTYFRRVLDRCEGMPVFELAPGDNPVAERALLQSPNAIVLPIVPEVPDDVARKFYWILSSDPMIAYRKSKDLAYKMKGFTSRISQFKSLVEVAYSCHWAEYRTPLETYLKKAQELETPTQEDWASRLILQHGSVAGSLTASHAAMTQALHLVDYSEHTPSVDDWNRSVAEIGNEFAPRWKILRLSHRIHF